MTMPRAISRVFAMARPARPTIEATAVVGAAAQMSGSMAQRAQRIARAVIEQALRDIDGDPTERMLLLLDSLDASPIARLATDPIIDTGAMIRGSRAAFMEARGWRRPTAAEWDAEDRRLILECARRLSKRYARHLSSFRP